MTVSDVGGLREKKKLETWRGIRAAAVDLFLERGYEAVSTGEIAAASHVSSATFFNYFSTKESVVFDPDPTDAATITGLLGQRPPGEAVWESLTHVLLSYTEIIGDGLAVQKRLRAASPALRRSGREVGDRINGELKAWVATAHPAVTRLDAELLVNVAVSTILAVYTTWEPEQGLAQLIDTMRDCLPRTEPRPAPRA